MDAYSSMRPSPPIARRSLLAAGAATLVAQLCRGSARAAAVPPQRPLFVATSMSSNAVAHGFEAVPPGLRTPSTELLSSDGRHSLAQLGSPATIVSLWADWCAPCLSEMHDLAELSLRHRRGLGVVALLQGSRLDVAGAAAKLEGVGARTLTSWIEPGGASVVSALGTREGARGFTLPCNLLFDRHGRLRGRSFGSSVLSHVDLDGAGVTDTGKRQLEHARTAWATPVADRFADALASGILDHVA